MNDLLFHLQISENKCFHWYIAINNFHLMNQSMTISGTDMLMFFLKYVIEPNTGCFILPDSKSGLFQCMAASW